MRTLPLIAMLLLAAGSLVAQGGPTLSDDERELADLRNRRPPAGPCQSGGITLLGITSGRVDMPTARLPPNHPVRLQYDAARLELEQAIKDNPPAVPGGGENGLIDSGVLLFATFVRLSIEGDVISAEEDIVRLSAALEQDPKSESVRESLWNAQRRRLAALEQKNEMDLKDARHAAATAPILARLAALEAEARAICPA